MERKLASIQTIASLAPIPGADNILVAQVLGWQCVVKREEFLVGDRCVYFEIDSVLPVANWNAHLRKGSNSDKPLRVKTIRLRNQLSQGLALPTTLLPAGEYEIGQDVTELVGATKYEPVIPTELHGKVKGNFPGFLHKTDEIRLQSVPEVLDEAISKGLVLIGTLKMDGTSFTAYRRGEDFGVCSRNLDLKETEDNAHWKIARKLKLEEILRGESRNLCIQGELVGPGIQGNRVGLKEVDLYLFNLFDIDAGKYLGHGELASFAEKHGLKVVKRAHTLDFFVGSPRSVGDLLEIANRLDYDNGTPAEGIVWRSACESYSEVLKGRMSFKTISNRYLLAYKE